MDLISKYELIEKIVKTTDQVVLQQVKTLLEEQGDFSLENDPELNAALRIAVKKANKGKLIPHATAMKQLRKKYSKKK